MAKILQSHHTLTNSIKTIISDFFELTKARLAISVVFSALAGYLIAVGEINVNIIFLLVTGGFCMVGSSNIFNQNN